MRAVLALETGFHMLNLEGGTLTPVADPEAQLPGTRFNDGRCDRQGRFLAGTMNRRQDAPNAALYRLDADSASRGSRTA